MFIVKRKHFKFLIITIFFFFLTNCQLSEPKNSHGINFLENRYEVLTVQKSNKNDVLNLLGNPHSKSIKSEDTWLYFERVITRGKMYKLGRNVLKTNNVLELKFNKFGVLDQKNIYDKDKMKKVKISEEKTSNTVARKSFVDKFLSSVRQKMYGEKKF